MLFKKIFNTSQAINPTLSIIRYTKDVWEKLYPKSSEEEWKLNNCPDNVYQFIKQNVFNHINNRPKAFKEIKEIKILTIDQNYIDWLEKANLNHSNKVLYKYIEANRGDDFWNERFLKSDMTKILHLMGFAFTSILINVKNGKTNYHISVENQKTIIDFIKNKFKTNKIFLPGWVLKGNDAIKYSAQIETIANEYFKSGRKIKIGACEEQNFVQKEMIKGFVPIPFYIPFVYETNVTQYKHHINFKDIKEQEKYEYAPNMIAFNEEERAKLCNLIALDVPGIVNMSPSLKTKESVFLDYRLAMLKKGNKDEDVLFY